jgi:hypothetical protein
VAPVLLRFLIGNRWTILLAGAAVALGAAYVIVRRMRSFQPDQGSGRPG